MEKEKQKYINDNIIEKGYNPEDLSNYITRIRGVGINSFSLNELKKLIEDFKTEQLNISLKSVNVKKIKNQHHLKYYIQIVNLNQKQVNNKKQN